MKKPNKSRASELENTQKVGFKHALFALSARSKPTSWAVPRRLLTGCQPVVAVGVTVVGGGIINLLEQNILTSGHVRETFWNTTLQETVGSSECLCDLTDSFVCHFPSVTER